MAGDTVCVSVSTSIDESGDQRALDLQALRSA